jgi:hypothetical protein
MLMGSVACVLSACGGGDPDYATNNPATSNPAAVYAAVAGATDGAAQFGAAPSGAASSSVSSSAAYQQGSAASQQALAGLQASQAALAYQSNLQVIHTYGAAAYSAAEVDFANRAMMHLAARVLETRQTNPELADDEARERMALTEVEFEKSFSLEKNRELAERKMQEGVVEPVGQQAYVPHEDCLDLRLPECAANPRLARN